MSTIQCCRGCKAPKRHTACWGHCPEYIAERAAYDAKKAEADRKRDIECGLTAQELRRAARAQKKLRHKKGK